jgi:hypothetical protein
MLDIFRWTALVAAIVLVGAVAGIVLSSHPPLPPSQQQASEEKQAEHAKEEGDKTLWNTWFPDSISLYTLFLVVFTAVLAFGGIIQLQFLGRAEQIAASSANAAKDAADATRDAVQLAEKTAERQLRAYVFIKPDTLPTIDEWNTIGIRLFVFNSGQTPAYKLTYWYAIQLSGYPLASELLVATEANLPMDQRTKTILNPGTHNEVIIKTGRALTSDERAAIISGTKAFYVYGQIDYRDAFDLPRFSKFRLHYTRESVALRALAWSAEGNEAN